jgi:hypothetical protein
MHIINRVIVGLSAYYLMINDLFGINIHLSQILSFLVDV